MGKGSDSAADLQSADSATNLSADSAADLSADSAGKLQGSKIDNLHQHNTDIIEIKKSVKMERY